MRIDLHHEPQALTETARNQQQRAAASASSASQGLGGEDQAQLSGAHVQVQALAAQASQLPEIREERVSSLRLAVQNGTYRPRAEQTAHAMFAHMIADPAA
jgi:flagellar biosynthesis anti-sigma factor FlgM